MPKILVIASLMVESKRETWHDIVRRAEDAGSDALELNFGCPHGMSERGHGLVRGAGSEYTEMITTWVKEAAKTPVIVSSRQRHGHPTYRVGCGKGRRLTPLA